MKKVVIGLMFGSLVACAHASAWYEVPMQTTQDFNNIPRRSLEETREMNKDPNYAKWVATNLNKARELNWRPGHHNADGTCYACHALRESTYNNVRRGIIEVKPIR